MKIAGGNTPFQPCRRMKLGRARRRFGSHHRHAVGADIRSRDRNRKRRLGELRSKRDSEEQLFAGTDFVGTDRFGTGHSQREKRRRGAAVKRSAQKLDFTETYIFSGRRAGQGYWRRNSRYF